MIIYIVQPGDSLNLIASRFGVSVKDILRHNWVRDDLTIYPGQFLFIPRNGHDDYDEHHPFTMMNPVIRHEAFYEVQPGDTLSRIAALFDTTVEMIVQANNLRGPEETIYPGQVLRIPIIEFK